MHPDHSDVKEKAEPSREDTKPAEDSSDDSSDSVYSSFEDDEEERGGTFQPTQLPVKTLPSAQQFVYEHNGVVIYDSNARMVQYLAMNVTTAIGKARNFLQSPSVRAHTHSSAASRSAVSTTRLQTCLSRPSTGRGTVWLFCSITH